MLTWVEISASALAHNVRVFKKLIGNKKLMAVVKSNAYGHGMNLIAGSCANNPFIDALGVANLEEALKLFKQGITKPLIVLSILDVEMAAKLTQRELNLIRLPLYDMATSRSLFKILKQRGLKARVHLKIDTGTTRIGFFPSQIPVLSNFFQSTKNHISLEAIYTHFANAEEDSKFTAYQNDELLKVENALHNRGFKNFYKHSACTAASIRMIDTHMDMTRLGIGLYGLNPNLNTARILYKKTGEKLKPVLSWYSRLIQIKKIQKGETVGYGRTFLAKKATTIGILPIGYYDGYDRKLSHKGRVIIRGTVCPVIGRICMNLTMVDVSALSKTVRAGDKVILMGHAPNSVTADTMANLTETINYEAVTKINPSIPRKMHT